MGTRKKLTKGKAPRRKTANERAASEWSFAAPVPILRILDEPKAREFYVDFLGFSVDFEHRFEPGTPIYMQVSKGGCALQLSEHFGDGTPGVKMKVPTTGLAAYHATLLAKKYKYARPGLVEQSWGERPSRGSDTART